MVSYPASNKSSNNRLSLLSLRYYRATWGSGSNLVAKKPIVHMACSHIFPPRRPYYAGIFLLFSVSFLPCYVPFQRECCSSCGFSNLLASHSLELSALFLVFVYCMVSGCLSCYVLVPGALAFYLPHFDLLWLFGLLCLTVCGHIIFISMAKMKNQHGHWVYWRRWVERNIGLM